MKQIDLVESAHLKKDIPKFNVGDTVCVYVKIKEGDSASLYFNLAKKETIEYALSVVVQRKIDSPILYNRYNILNLPILTKILLHQ